MGFSIKIFKKLSYLSTSFFIHNISSKHDRETTTTERRIFRNTSDGLFSILELKLKCCFCTRSIELLFIFVFITCHSRILQCAALFLLLVPWTQLRMKPHMNKVCLHLFVYGFILSLKKRAYLKCERLLLYSNDTFLSNACTWPEHEPHSFSRLWVGYEKG